MRNPRYFTLPIHIWSYHQSRGWRFKVVTQDSCMQITLPGKDFCSRQIWPSSSSLLAIFWLSQDYPLTVSLTFRSEYSRSHDWQVAVKNWYLLDENLTGPRRGAPFLPGQSILYTQPSSPWLLLPPLSLPLSFPKLLLGEAYIQISKPSSKSIKTLKIEMHCNWGPDTGLVWTLEILKKTVFV